jgi:hypothetical protein
MKKVLFSAACMVCLSLMAFVSPVNFSPEIISITDPFTSEVEVCYTLPDEGDVSITITCVETNRVVGEYVDKQGHGTHCAGIACGGGPTGTYVVDFYFNREHASFYIQRR